MASELQKSSVKTFMAQPSTIKRVEELLGDRSSQFMTSVSSMVGADDKLASCEPVSLFMACLTAAALDLPINKNLGFAHIIPYDNNRAGVTEAQFQMGWKGYVQLAQRTGQYETIKAIPVYEGQLIEENPLDGNTYDWKAKTGDTVIGYVSQFKLTTGFRQELYMSVEEIDAHARQYSKAYAYDLRPTTKYKNSPWSTNFNAMALKTVIKQIISKWGPMSVDSPLKRAIEADSAVIKEDGTPSYIDGQEALDNVKADDNKKSAILAAAQEAETVGNESDERIHEVKVNNTVDEAFPGSENLTAASAKPAKKESVREKADKWVKDKKATANDNDSSN